MQIESGGAKRPRLSLAGQRAQRDAAKAATTHWPVDRATSWARLQSWGGQRDDATGPLTSADTQRSDERKTAEAAPTKKQKTDDK